MIGVSMKLLQKMCDTLPAFEGNLYIDQISFRNRNIGSEDVFSVTELAANSIALAGAALIQYAFGHDALDRQIIVDQRLSYLWSGSSVRPVRWSLASPWDDLAGDYQTQDGWIRLHTNAPHHRNVVCKILGDLDRAEMAKQVETWSGAELEGVISSEGGAAANLMSTSMWNSHPQAIALSKEFPIISEIFEGTKLRHVINPSIDQTRPLKGLKVLDLTRILAGPIATRFLAGFGATVLRIDPPLWDEGDHVIDITPGKKCATLDLSKHKDLEIMQKLILEADVMVHGLRADALEKLGLGDEERRKLNPSLIDISLNAYGWTGPWRNRRGFDSLVQMSTGIAQHGMEVSGLGVPRPMTVQALDHATGYLMAATVLAGLNQLKTKGQAMSAKLSLAATAELLKSTRKDKFGGTSPVKAGSDFLPDIKQTSWGNIQRLKSPIMFSGLDMHWSSPAIRLHSSAPMF
jgi:hypothetical protein